MRYMFLAALVLLLPSSASAAGLCKNSKNTLEMNACLSEEVRIARTELGKYLEESRRHYAEEPKSIAALDKAQKSWLDFQEAHCRAVYEIWSEGTIRNAKYADCLLKSTRRRIHDLWEIYLTFVDSTPPLLPEPGSSE
ncbi:MAG: lysozyme inhibitor LprI family protein [Alphaproteobacteria bacterium]|nr:lysozyme inhibitor LprI family protein [Alphaproteobacteria bacterium]